MKSLLQRIQPISWPAMFYCCAAIAMLFPAIGCENVEAESSEYTDLIRGTREDIVENTWQYFVDQQGIEYEELEEKLEELRMEWIHAKGEEDAQDIYNQLHDRLNKACAWRWKISVENLDDGAGREKFILKVESGRDKEEVKFSVDERPTLMFDWHPGERFAFSLKKDGPGPVNDTLVSESFKGPLALFQTGMVKGMTWDTQPNHMILKPEKAFKAKLSIRPKDEKEN